MSRRTLHGSIQLIACAVGGLGVLTVIGTHTATGLSNTGGGDVTKAYSVHTWMGYVSIVFMMLQVRD